MKRSSLRLGLATGAFVALLAGGCAKKGETYHTTVEVLQAQVFGESPERPSVMDLDLAFTECPGRQRNVVRGDKAFAACAKKYKDGDKIGVDVKTTWRPDRGEFRAEIVKVGDCERVADPRDEASYEVIQQCADITVNGIVMGVRCDRSRSAELVAKCPWFKRK